MANNCSGQYADKSGDKTTSVQSRNVDNNYVSEFTVPKMNCPSKEYMIRMSLENIGRALYLNSIFQIAK